MTSNVNEIRVFYLAQGLSFCSVNTGMHFSLPVARRSGEGRSRLAATKAIYTSCLVSLLRAQPISREKSWRFFNKCKKTVVL